MVYQERPCNADDCNNWLKHPELCQECMDASFTIKLNCNKSRMNLLQYLIANKYQLPINWREMSIKELKSDMINFISNKEMIDMLSVYNSKRMLNLIFRLANNAKEESTIIEFNNGNKVTCIPANQTARSKIKKYE